MLQDVTALISRGRFACSWTVQEKSRWLKELVGDNEGEGDDDFEDIEGFTDGGYRLIYKENLLSALEAVHKANGNGCKGRLNVVEQEKHIKGFDGCIKLSCKTCGLAHKMYSSEASLGKPDVRYDSKNLNSRMVMTALESRNGGTLLKH